MKDRLVQPADASAGESSTPRTAEGFGVKVLKEIIKLRKQDKDERDEHETLLDVYMRAMESAEPQPIAEAA